MARIIGLEEVDPKLRAELQQCLRVCDESVVLPSAARSRESGSFKNVVFRFSGADTELDPEVFSPQWFSGVSVVVVPTEAAEALLRDPVRRRSALDKLRDNIKSEMTGSDVQVGPDLDGDESDRDKAGWMCGFDSPSCCVGLFSARQSRAPEAGATGMNRAHSAYYLVCKAGGGLAAQTFHSRLCTSIKAGKTLDACFSPGGSPGSQALRRVSLAGQRNRTRILEVAAKTLGFFALDTISDNAASPSAPHRGCIPNIDVTYNCLRKIDGLQRSTWQYSAGCIDTVASQGLVTSSNLSEGFIAFTSSNDEFRVNLRNEAYNTLPFVTERIKTTKEIAEAAAKAHKSALTKGEAHPDVAFIRERFVWKSKEFNPPSTVDIEPPSFWGSHASESFLSSWARELGVSTYKTVRMAPEVVAVSAMEPAKLRAAVKRAQST
jgi:hypothetical protein